MAKQPANEEALVRLAQSLEKRPVGYQALHIHFSRLQPFSRTASVMRIAESHLRRHATTYDDHLFLLSNADMVLVCKGKRVDDVMSCLDQVRSLVKDDPLITGPTANPDDFATWDDLSVKWAAFSSRCEDLLAERLAAKEQDKKGEGDQAEVPSDPIDAGKLSRLENALRAVDLSIFLRRQPVCALTGEEQPKQIFEELYISVSEVQRVTMPHVNLRSNSWLFSQLTQTFDNRMLAILKRNGAARSAEPFSINLNLATMAANAFVTFAQDLMKGRKARLVVEMQVGDVFTNLRDFDFARDFAREIGFRICLDGLSHTALSFLDFGRLGFDLYKMRWEAGIDELSPEQRGAIADNVKRAGAERMILCHCDRPHAVQYGRGLGIGLFQGWYIDNALKRKTVA